MKHLLPLFLLFALKAGAQITYEAAYPPSPYPGFGVVHLSAAGYKYAISDSDQIVLYNMNHTVYTTITIPNQPSGNYNYVVTWISDELFNTNPADIEYILTYTSISSGIPHTRVYDQTGNLLLARDTFVLNNTLSQEGVPVYGVVHTSSGVKLLLRNQLTYASVVYSLPGVLPCSMCDGGVIAGMQQSPSGPSANQQQMPAPYPNPTTSNTTIPYELPSGIRTGQMVIYDLAGREVKRYSVTNAFTTLEIAGGELAAGTYSYCLQTSEGVTYGQKFVVAE